MEVLTNLASKKMGVAAAGMFLLAHLKAPTEQIMAVLIVYLVIQGIKDCVKK